MALTQERLKEVLTYDPEMGIFRWKLRLSKRVRIGDIAGCLSSDGYIRLRIDKVLYLAHRLAWIYETGELSDELEIDHRNCLKADNRWCNLRPATMFENRRNTRRHRDGSSMFKGVTWDKSCGKWFTRIWREGRNYQLGYFDDEQEAAAAYDALAPELHGEFARTNEAA